MFFSNKYSPIYNSRFYAENSFFVLHTCTRGIFAMHSDAFMRESIHSQPKMVAFTAAIEHSFMSSYHQKAVAPKV